MEPKGNLNGTQMESKWNLNGTLQEPEMETSEEL